MYVRTLLVWFVVFLCVAVSRSTAAEPPKPRPDKAAAQFQEVFAELKGILAEARTLQVKYRDAKPEEHAELKKQWGQLMEKGDALHDRFIEAAASAYAEAPNTDNQVTAMLLDVLAEYVRTENYEQAFPLGKLLVTNKCPDKRVYPMAGIAAFAVNEFDAAENYLQEAKRAKLLDKDKLSATCLASIPQCKEAWAKEEKIRAAEAKADNLPRVLLQTSKGHIELELFENEAPNTVANFISLVEKKFYDGVTFHRVLPGFMAQSGDDGKGGPGYTIACECYEPNHRLHFGGSLSMANTGRRDTGGSQFFLTFLPTPNLNGQHTVFGRVIKGFDVLSKLQRRNPDDPDPPPPDKIITAKVLRKQKHDYVPKTKPEK